jgi:prepilin-type N-terminal cleavage/methylation domain-containing protein
MDGSASNLAPRCTRFAGCRRFQQRGFTIVELIAVVILLSILGVFAMGRMTSPAMFAPAIVSEALVAQLRAAQQIAVSRRDAVVSVTVDQQGADWRLRIESDVDGVMRVERVDADGTTMTATSGGVTGMLDVSSALTLSFDHAGDLDAVSIGGVAGVPAAGVAVSVAGDSVRQICIYPSGYANSDACS